MSNNIFISHYDGDTNIAEIFSKCLSKISLKQITPWFSSNTAGNDGLKPGDIWFTQILSRLKNSGAVIAIITPNSINRPWIYFETGIAQALEECKVIPVCIGIKRDDLLPPLGLYQTHQLNDYRSAVSFFSKLFDLFTVSFDEDLSKDSLKKMVSEISKITFNTEKTDAEPLEMEKTLQDLKSHIDRRFIELLENNRLEAKIFELMEKQKSRSTEHQTHEHLRDIYHFHGSTEFSLDSINIPTGYSVKFSVEFPDFKNELIVEVREDDSFQDVTDNLYIMLVDYINAYTYLEEWIITNENETKYVVIREIASLIPAKSIFKPSTNWKIKRLEKPYDAVDSQGRIDKT